MAKKQVISGLSHDTIIEVVLRKNVTVEAYRAMFEKSKKQGWSIQGYKLNTFSEPINDKI